MPMIKIDSKIGNYTISFGNLKYFLSSLQALYPKRCFVIDEKVWRLYDKKFFMGIEKQKIILLRSAENKKNLRSVQSLYDALTKSSAKRNLVLISIGGGIIQDITGFLVSTLYRGLKWIFIPTTLLAQSDSCIGSKTSLNYKNFKNLIGTFYPPHKIFIDINFINTLSKDDFYSGLGEIVKLHIIGGKKYLNYIIRKLPVIKNKQKTELLEAIRNSLMIKKGYIEADEFDLGRRNFLNYGHCFGHALETTSNFSIPHGQAVVLGMIFTNAVAQARGLLSRRAAQNLLDHVLTPIVLKKPNFCYTRINRIIAAMKKDKKRTGKKLSLIMLKDKYRLVKINDLTEDEVARAVKKLDRLLKNKFCSK